MRVLTLRALGLGDLLTAVPALRAVRRAFPQAHHQLAAPAVLEPLAMATGAVDEFLAVDELAPIPRRAHGPDLAVNLHGSGPESHRLLMDARPNRLVAFRHPDVPESHDGPGWDNSEHEVSRWCRLLEHHGMPSDPPDLDVDPPAGPVPNAAVGATVVHPGAKAPARRWPWQRFAAVARAERRTGRAVVVTGGPDEVTLAARVAEAAGLSEDVVLAGRTDLAALARVVRVAGRVVCGDTGVAHLATAVGTPSVVVFGPMSPDRWGPPANRPQHRILWAGRTGDPLGDVTFPGLLDVTVDEVVAALEDLPERTVEPV